MPDKSQYLDNLIKEMDEASQASFNKESKYVVQNIERFQRRWKRKVLIEHYFLPILILVLVANEVFLLKTDKLIFTVVPLIAVLSLVLLQVFTNTQTNRIDLGQDLINYGKKQLKILRDQLFLFKWFRRIIYPVFFVSIGTEIIFTLKNQSELWIFITLAIKLAGLGGLIYYERKSVEDLKTQERNFNFY